MTTLVCNGCGFSGSPDEFEPAMSVYHDVRCPKCKTTDVDTSDSPDGYGYGDHNFLETGEDTKERQQ